MRNVVITSNAGAAWDELGRWSDTLTRQAAEAEDIRRERPNARVIFALDDPRLPGEGYPDHHARIRAHAAVIVQEHIRLARRAPSVDLQQKHMDAAAAWRKVLTERDRSVLESRLKVAITASARVIERCRYVIRMPRRQQKEAA
jgi:chromatin segregation and condensation protein Rec8/ScpA/Scc1 (kleisin family)